MSYYVEMTKEFRARQALPSPVRRAQNLPPLQPENGYEVALRAGITFADTQIGQRGWFVDTDSLDGILNDISVYLGSDKWTTLFPFRPTFELVSQWVYRQLQPQVPGLVHVTLDNKTLGVSTVYKIDGSTSTGKQKKMGVEA